MPGMKVYMAVTPDQYELPLFVADKPKTVGAPFGHTGANVLEYISHRKKGINAGKRRGVGYVRVEIDESEEEYDKPGKERRA